MLYSKKTVMKQGAAPERELGASVVPTKVEKLINQWSKKFPKPPITTGKDGTITIPAASFASAQNSILMNSVDDGQQLLHNGGDYVHPETSYVVYEIESDAENLFPHRQFYNMAHQSGSFRHHQHNYRGAECVCLLHQRLLSRDGVPGLLFSRSSS